MPKYHLMFARFPYGNVEDSRSVDWLINTTAKISHDPRFRLSVKRCNDTPITMTRNRVLEDALKEDVDLLLMIDNDVAPDCELGADPTAKPFWETSVEFMLAHEGPCVIAAPYCGPPPHENVYVFQWGNLRSHHPNVDGKLDQFVREEAAKMSGIHEVAALATGLMLIDMRAIRKLPRPFTYYEWEGDGGECPHCGERKPGPQAGKASTEDVTFTRDLSMLGVKMYCNWDAWAGHVKQTVVRKPRFWGSDMIAAKLRGAIVNGHNTAERLKDIKPQSGRFDKDIEEAMRKYRQTTLSELHADVVNYRATKALIDRAAAKAPHRPDTRAELDADVRAAFTLSSTDHWLPVAEEIVEGRTQETLDLPPANGFAGLAMTADFQSNMMSGWEVNRDHRPLQIEDLYGFHV